MPPRQDENWVQICQAAELDPDKRLAARQAILGHADALDCTFYRPDDNDPDAEEEDLGDARVLFTGPFQAPADWSEQQRDDYFDDSDPALFFSALIECEAQPASKAFFLPEPGDYVAVMTASGTVEMYYLYDCHEDDNGRACVLIRDDEAFE